MCIRDRVGICGRVTLKEGKVYLIKDVSSLNIRRSRQIIGASENVIGAVWDEKTNTIRNTLIISPPKCGKTTILRDLARSLSHKGFRVGICDERSEIAGCHNGEPSYDLGGRTDILDGCPKAEGLSLIHIFFELLVHLMHTKNKLLSAAGVAIGVAIILVSGLFG